MKNHIVHSALLVFVSLMGSCATTDSEEAKKAEKLHLVMAENENKLQDLRDKYGLGNDSVMSFKSQEEYLEWKEKYDKMWEEYAGSGSDTIIDADGNKYIVKNEVREETKFGNIGDILGIDISPNPTSTFVTLKFFSKKSADIMDKLFPRDLTVDLYYLDQKVHTFTFPNSYGEETIPEQYLQKDGSYRVVYGEMSVPFMVRKN